MYTYISITEVTLLSILIWLCSRQSQAIADFEHAVEMITLDTAHGPIAPFVSKRKDIQLHLHSGRRHNSPLSLVVIQPDPSASQRSIARAIQEVQHQLRSRCTLSTLGRSFDRVLRRTDFILEQSQSEQLVIVSPMTNADAATLLVERLQQAAEQAQIPIQCGHASFPNEALTLDELLACAESRIQSISSQPTTLPIPHDDLELTRPAPVTTRAHL